MATDLIANKFGSLREGQPLWAGQAGRVKKVGVCLRVSAVNEIIRSKKTMCSGSYDWAATLTFMES